MDTGDVSLACMSVLVDELVLGGMQHACVSPGSRSTPIALALERDPRVTVHVHLDERASAFFALGIAKPNEPVVVACTSGTAAAELLPGLVEASQARVPLMVLTADRPPRLRGTGANQTIDQTGLYGRYVRWFTELPIPALEDRAVWRQAGAELLQRAFSFPAGPVHANLPFEEPLTPKDLPATFDAPGSQGVARTHAQGLYRTSSTAPRPDDVDRLADAVVGVERGMLIMGGEPGGSEGPLRLARRLGWPVLAEPTSQARAPGEALSAGQPLISSPAWLEEHRPQLVLQLGATPTSRSTQSLVASSERLIVVDALHPDADPERRATWRVWADGGSLASRVVDQIGGSETANAWLDAWTTADRAARVSMDGILDAWEAPYEGRVARDLPAEIVRYGTLAVGSSMPIRDLDYYMAPRRELFVVANRGASGIDGFVSTVLGRTVKDNEMGRPTYALCGDLTLLHDAGSLLWSARRGYDAVFVVVNNDGGAIFDFLPQRTLPEHERLFTTPHGLDLGALCAAAGAGHTRISRADELIPAVERATTTGGVHVVEVPSDRARNVRRHAEVQAAVDAALA